MQWRVSWRLAPPVFGSEVRPKSWPERPHAALNSCPETWITRPHGIRMALGGQANPAAVRVNAFQPYRGEHFAQTPIRLETWWNNGRRLETTRHIVPSFDFSTSLGICFLLAIGLGGRILRQIALPKR